MDIGDFINIDMLRQPYNWITVVLMLAIGVMALTLLAAPLGQIGGLTSVI